MKTCPFKSGGCCGAECGLALSPNPKEMWPDEFYCAVAIGVMALLRIADGIKTNNTNKTNNAIS